MKKKKECEVLKYTRHERDESRRYADQLEEERDEARAAYEAETKSTMEMAAKITQLEGCLKTEAMRIGDLKMDRDNAMKSRDTYREQAKAAEKDAYDMRCHLNEVADYFGISTDLWPAEKVKRLKLMRDDKADIETKWEELCRAIGAHGPESDPLFGTDTNDMIHARAMERIRDMVSDEF